MVTSYAGEVSPGGARTSASWGLTVTKPAVDPEMSDNCYLLHCSGTDEAVLIDAPRSRERLLRDRRRARSKSSVTTHQHSDHHRALAAVKAAPRGHSSVAGAPDADAIEEQTGVTVDRQDDAATRWRSVRAT